VPLGLVGLLPWTPLLPLALAPLRTRPRPLAYVFAAAWVTVGFVFFSLAQAKRSVYLLPLYPAVAFLVGTGAVAPPVDDRLARGLSWCARLYTPAIVLLAALAGASALGLDPAALIRPWLKPVDAAGAAAVMAAISAVAGVFVFLALSTIAAAPALARATARAEWPRVVVLVTVLMVAWTAAFDGLVHPVIARTRSLAPFLTRVGELVAPDASLYTRFPADPGLRFYSPRPLAPWSASGLAGPADLLLWEDEWRRLRTPGGSPLPVVAASDAAQPAHGHLLLVAAPSGGLVVVATPAGPPAPPGLRTGSRRQ